MLFYCDFVNGFNTERGRYQKEFQGKYQIPGEYRQSCVDYLENRWEPAPDIKTFVEGVDEAVKQGK